MSVPKSLYERIGGETTVNLAIPIFFQKVLSTPQISHFFENSDIPHLISNQKAFLTMALGGTYPYSAYGMRAAQTALKLVTQELDDSHFESVTEQLIETLQELQISQADIDEIVAIVKTAQSRVSGQP